MDPFEKEVQRTVREQNMLEPGHRVVVAISGGSDSVALLRSLLGIAPGWRLDLSAAHLNHGLRGREADEDEQWVRELCKGLAVPLRTSRLEPGPESGVEAWARERRYQFLASAAREAGAARIAVGHHADDAAETVLLNLIRGAGPAGLSGIAPVREAGPGQEALIIRPLIRQRRQDIIAYLERQGLGWREDSSNLDPRFLRNRVRNEIIPLLESINPGARDALARAAETSRLEAEALRVLAGDWLDRHGSEAGGLLGLELRALRKAPAGMRFAAFREAIRRMKGDLERIALSHLAALDELASGSAAHGSLDLPGLAARREYEVLYLGGAGDLPAPGKPATSPAREMILPVPGGVLWRGPGGADFRISSEVTARPGGDPDNSIEAWLDVESAGSRLVVRSRWPGDRYRPVGLKGTRKLKDVMNELKIPPRERDAWPLLMIGDEIAWVPGCRPAGAASAAPDAGRVVRVWISPPLLPRDGIIGSVTD